MFSPLPDNQYFLLPTEDEEMPMNEIVTTRFVVFVTYIRNMYVYVCMCVCVCVCVCVYPVYPSMELFVGQWDRLTDYSVA